MAIPNPSADPAWDYPGFGSSPLSKNAERRLYLGAFVRTWYKHERKSGKHQVPLPIDWPRHVSGLGMAGLTEQQMVACVIEAITTPRRKQGASGGRRSNVWGTFLHSARLAVRQNQAQMLRDEADRVWSA